MLTDFTNFTLVRLVGSRSESTATWRVPYQYTAKEMDSETGLYYFGARYYDPRTSVWQSPDPILEKYLPNLSDRIAAERGGGRYSPERDLPGFGGVYSPMNMGLFSYVHNNPIGYHDPDGNKIDYGPYVVLNPKVRAGLEQLNAAIISIYGKRDQDFTIGISGGIDLLARMVELYLLIP